MKTIVLKVGQWLAAGFIQAGLAIQVGRGQAPTMSANMNGPQYAGGA
ncbi:MAG: hypothetical protein HQL20_08140 [Candidatus Omnitrophica bacterium]|nr:hypothetical protein [Candidatus Omnitrophota bacterium]